MVSRRSRNSPNLAGELRITNFSLSFQGERFVLLDGNLININGWEKTIRFDFILVIFMPGSHEQA